MKKRWKFTEYNPEEAEELHNSLRVHPIFCQLLVQRGIKTFDQAERFFRPNLAHLHDPFLMKGMETAVRRIEQALIKKEKVLIYGDYDVDGTTAVSTVMTFFSKYHNAIDYYIPDRYKEGYGISMQGMEYAIQNRYGLIIALDCGIKGHEPIAFAKSKGIDCIVCDHHLPDATLPDAVAILNPKQEDCDYPYKELSGCAIGFKLIEAFAQYNDIPFEEVTDLLDLVAVSLACDFVPLTGENRTMAYFGLQKLNENPRMGLKVAKQLLERQPQYNIRDIVFGIGPLINAAGRIEHAKEAANLLLATEEQVAYNYAKNLMLKNQERRDIEKQIVKEAHVLVDDDVSFGDKKTTVLYRPHWHKGVVGIVASRMVDSFFKPTVILTQSDGKLVGSVRSAGGFDIHEALEQCDDLLLNWGGHKYAAGLTLEEKNLEAFKNRFDNVVATSLAPQQHKPTQRIDAEVELKAVDQKFWNILKQFAPFGPENMRPVFFSKFLKDTGYSKLIKDQHIKLVVRQGDSKPIEGIAFGYADYFEDLVARKPFHLCYVLEENVYMGKSKLQVNVKDIRFN